MKTLVRTLLSRTVCTLLLVALQWPAHSADAAAPKGHARVFKPWINGVASDEPPLQVQRYDENTYVIRQSIRTNFEGPFLYLLFGQDRALLVDTGAGGLAVRPTIDQIISQWSARHRRTAPSLVVAHSHSHGDHHKGDIEFADRPRTTIVGLQPAEVARFFKIAEWPNDVVSYDLGGRVLDIIPTPGHEPSHIMVFDRKTRLLLSGDSLGPYRLYVSMSDAQTYRDSIDRVAAFAQGKQVSWILGAHIEMTTKPGELIPNKAPSHPDEHRLEIAYSNLPELQSALHAMGNHIVEESHRDFVISPRPLGNAPPVAPPPPPNQ